MKKLSSVALAFVALAYLCPLSYAQEPNYPTKEFPSMGEAQKENEAEARSMREELNDLKSTINESTQAMTQLQKQVKQRQAVKEFHLIVKEADLELCPGVSVHALTYNGQSPGPVIRVNTGDTVRIILHNQLSAPTSLYFQGMKLPYKVDGLPRKDNGLVAPNENYAYQFVASEPGTFWYHPQVLNADQQAQGLAGVLVVETPQEKSYDRDYTMVISQFRTEKGATYFTVNGKCAPATAPMELVKDQKILLRVINNSSQIVPLSLTGHRLEVVSINGSEESEPHVLRDTTSVGPLARADLLFTADNPGVWSLSSGLVQQTTNGGKFPGGIATVVRYQTSQ